MQTPNSDKLARVLGRLVYAGRWLLLPMYTGLALVLVFYVWHYVADLYTLCLGFRKMSEADLMLAVLTTVDTVMLGNLLAFIMIGSYAIFVQPFDVGTGAPGWLRTITSSTLKTKISTALIGITSIHLLRDFIGAERESMEVLTRHLIIHGVFIASAIGLAFTDRLGHGTKPDNDH
jgi:uncharacterized protein (TIGR00645 family)